MNYVPELHIHSKNKTETKLDLSNYPTNSNLKEVTGIDTSKIAKKTNSKSDVDRLDIGELDTTPPDLSKLSNVVQNDVAEKSVYDEMVKKI